MVVEGYAVVYARQQQLNFWSQPNPVMPWDFRRSN
jgi:endonuclease YncB( thermonuclease family)